MINLEEELVKIRPKIVVELCECKPMIVENVGRSITAALTFAVQDFFYWTAELLSKFAFLYIQIAVRVTAYFI